MESSLHNAKTINIDRDGMLVHMTWIDNFATIVKDGLVAGAHFHPVKTAEFERCSYDPVTYGCPCGQEIIRKGNEDRRKILFFSIIGNRYRGERTSFQGRTKPYVERDFGVVIDPYEFYRRFPANDAMKSVELKAFTGDVDAKRFVALHRYYRHVNLEIQDYLTGSGSGGSEFTMSSCIPWNTLTALIVPNPMVRDKFSAEKRRQANIETLIRTMEMERPVQERKPIYDDTGALLYDP
jgi:hypothetical protein